MSNQDVKWKNSLAQNCMFKLRFVFLHRAHVNVSLFSTYTFFCPQEGARKWPLPIETGDNIESMRKAKERKRIRKKFVLAHGWLCQKVPLIRYTGMKLSYLQMGVESNYPTSKCATNQTILCPKPLVFRRAI